MQLKEMMDEICSRWSLPKDYIEFLFNHENNLYVNVDDDDDEDLSYEIEIYVLEVYLLVNMAILIILCRRQ